MTYAAAYNLYGNHRGPGPKAEPQVTTATALAMLERQVEAIVTDSSTRTCYRTWDHEEVARQVLAFAELAQGRFLLDAQTVVLRSAYASYAVIHVSRDRKIMTVYVYNSGTEDYDGEDAGYYRAQFNTSSLAKDLRMRLEPLPKLSAVQMVEGLR